jgi:hypothetical protein
VKILAPRCLDFCLGHELARHNFISQTVVLDKVATMKKNTVTQCDAPGRCSTGINFDGLARLIFLSFFGTLTASALMFPKSYD